LNKLRLKQNLDRIHPGISSSSTCSYAYHEAQSSHLISPNAIDFSD